MGIQINKAMGYGVQNLRWDEDTPNDSRFDFRAYLDSYHYDKHSIKDFISWVSGNPSLIQVLAESEGWYWDKTSHNLFLKDLSRLEKESVETSMSRFTLFMSKTAHGEGFLLIKPPTMARWFRGGDPIDEASFLSEGKASYQTEVENLTEGSINPYAGKLRRVKEPEPDVSKYLNAIYGNLPFLLDYGDSFSLQHELGVPPKVVEFVKEGYRSRIPVEVLALMDWMGFFKEKIKEEMRPMVATWWG